MPGAPPSFSSFPDSAQKTAPPSFGSFPSARAPPANARRSPPPPPHDDDTRPAKRPRAADFLDGIKEEISAKGLSLEPPHGWSQGQQASSSGRGKGKEWRSESDRDQHRLKDRDREREPFKEKEHRKKDRHRTKEERDSDFGAKREKPYQLVKTSRPEKPPVELPPSQTPAEPRLFYVDRSGDELNIRFGGLHKGDIPKYRRIGGGRVVGLNSGLRITKESAYTGRGLEIASNSTYRTPRYVDPRSARHMTDKYTKRLILTSRRRLILRDDTSFPEDPFLAGSSDPTRFVRFDAETTITEKLALLEHESGQDYRSISGLVKPSDIESLDEDDDDVFGGAGIAGGESQDEYLKRRNLEMDRALRANPSDADTWLQFVDFQDEVSLSSFVGSAAKRALSKAERTSTSEIKLAILDRALAVDANRNLEKLLLAYLRAASEVWDPKKVLERWDETLRNHPTLTGLWIEYVSWRQTSWANFTVRSVVDVYVECFSVLRTAMFREVRESQGREMLEANAIYLFLRCCLMLRQAGFAERGMAAFQAIIELNFFRPDRLQRPGPQESESDWVAGAFDELELFWESGGPRVGEAAAKGWKHTPEDVDPPVASPPHEIASALSGDANPFERWAESERLSAEGAQLPARADDPGVDDDIDPFRVVIFDDVRDLLFVVHSPDARIQLVYAFLSFLGLPFVPPNYPTTTAFSTDSFIHSELAERPRMEERFWPRLEQPSAPFDTIDGEAMEPERKSALLHPFEAPFRTTPVAVDLLFGTRPKWFQTISKDDLACVDVTFVRNTFSLLRPVLNDTFFTLSSFSFEAAQSPKTAAKLAKLVLKDNRQNLALWDAYARIERQRGKIEDARAVYATALSMCRTFDERDQSNAPLLWRAWAEMEWEEGKPMLALKVLVAAAGSQDIDLSALAKKDPDVRPSPTQILKARQHFTAELEGAFQAKLSHATLRNRNVVAFSFAIFEYISQGLAPAVEVLERHLFRLDCDGVAGSAEHEEAFMLCVKLLWRHAAAGKGYKPGQLSAFLERAIKEYPSNSLFLTVFYHNELRMKIQNRVRRVLEQYVLNEKTANSEGWLFAIFAELHLDARSPSVWGVRNLLDRAVDSPRTRCSPSLWVLYIDFEIRNNELGRAKALVYRALRECPWVKELYLKPFVPPLRTQYRSIELRQMYRLLVSEKGLRSRLELDDFLGDDRFSDDGLEELPEDEAAPMLLRETEELFDERKRLMPY